jgi:hypothetical protein
MSKSEKSNLPSPPQPPPPYEEVESGGRVEAGPIDPEVGENENTPLLGPIAPFPYHRNRRWRYLKAILIGWTLVLIIYAAVEIIGSKGDEVWKKKVVVVGQWIFIYLFGGLVFCCKVFCAYG